jgi:protein-tyrosine phosphatase
MSQPRPRTLLFVCLGNICRSPTAHTVFNQRAKNSGLNIEIDSAGTSAHEGIPPDPRSIAAGKARGYNFEGLSSRKVTAHDFEYYDLILAMDSDNLKLLKQKCPVEYQNKLVLFANYAKAFEELDEVPDPYYGGKAGFEFVLDLIEDASDGLLEELKKQA